ncbi:MAG: 30S ribosomal protein S17e [Candidatus Pacearchaeota archaeon]
MGKVKTKIVKRVGKALYEAHGDEFSQDFEKNKQVVMKYLDVNKKLRNVIAGYLVKLKKLEKATK